MSACFVLGRAKFLSAYQEAIAAAFGGCFVPWQSSRELGDQSLTALKIHCSMNADLTAFL